MIIILFAVLEAIIAGHVYQYVYQYTSLFKTLGSLIRYILAKIQGVKKRAKNVGKSKLSASEPQSRSTEGHQEHYESTYNYTTSLIFKLMIVKFILETIYFLLISIYANIISLTVIINGQ